jgi:hypothetical protein
MIIFSEIKIENCITECKYYSAILSVRIEVKRLIYGTVR